MNWKYATLDDVIELRRGFDLPSAERVPGPFPVVSAGKLNGTHHEAMVKGPGFAVGRATNLGRPQWCDTDFWPLNTTLYATDFKGNNPKWLYHLFETLDLAGYDSGSVQPMLNRNYIKHVPVLIPPRGIQDAISEVLGALDDKIAANRRVVEASEDLRAHLWKRACASGHSEVPLSSLARFVNGRAFTKDASGTGKVVIRIAELNSGIGASTVRNDIVVADDHLARPGDLLLAWSGSLTAARWYRDEAIVNQHIFKVIPGEDFEMWAVASAVESKLADFKEIAKNKATTMGHIRRSDLDQPVVWPVLSREEISVGRSLWSRALSAEMENEVLVRARDELLPLLMNGRITVEDAEKASESVL